jgi:LCP family protein required for cell wall assembly
LKVTQMKHGPGGERRKTGTKALWITLVVIAAVILCAAGMTGIIIQRMQSGSVKTEARQTQAALPTPEGTEAAEEPSHQAAAASPALTPAKVPIYQVDQIDPNVVNVLLVGTDSRAAGRNIVSGNADTIILASYHKLENRLTLVSFMRDSIVAIGDLNGPYGKLKRAYTDGGMGMLINTLNDFFQLDIQQYIAVGLDGFVTFIDETLGGLDLELNAQEISFINERISSYENEIPAIQNCPPVVSEPGLVHLTGAQTLIFVRNRSTTYLEGTDAPSDFDRVARQQEVLKLIYEKIVTEKPLTAIPGLISFGMQHVETNLTVSDLYSLAEPLMEMPAQIPVYTVPFPGGWEYGGDGTGILFDRREDAPKLHELLYGKAEE